MPLRGMNLRQRIVVLIGLAAGVYVFGSWARPGEAYTAGWRMHP
jgi:hypothetical protein